MNEAIKSVINAKSDARLEILNTLAQIPQTTSAQSKASGIKIAKTPAPVAIPLPPLKFRYGL